MTLQSPLWRMFHHAADSTPHDYTYKPASKNCNVHNGQQKLLRAEQEFLLRHLPQLDIKPGGVVVVYAGAAPGTHIVQLITQFPHVRFALYDTADFDRHLHRICDSDDSRVYLCNSLFTDDDAQAWSSCGMSVLFISDIRSTVHDKRMHYSVESKQEDNTRVEIGIARDMEDQARWVHLMQPQGALLKFRPPYWYDWAIENNEIWTYLPGNIMLPCHGPPHTSECRLDVDVAAALYGQKTTLCTKHYQDVMAFFNSQWRPAYDQDVDKYVTDLLRSYMAMNC